MNNRKLFEVQLNKLLREAERAIVRGDKIESYALSMELLELVGSWRDRLNNQTIREVLNNPVAADIAKRLGVQPKQALS
jgi:hypothetical protein